MSYVNNANTGKDDEIKISKEWVKWFTWLQRETGWESYLGNKCKSSDSIRDTLISDSSESDPLYTHISPERAALQRLSVYGWLY